MKPGALADKALDPIARSARGGPVQSLGDTVGIAPNVIEGMDPGRSEIENGSEILTRWQDAHGRPFIDDDAQIRTRADGGHTVQVRNKSFQIPAISDYFISMFDILGYKELIRNRTLEDSLLMVESQLQSTIDMACWRFEDGRDFSDRPYPVPFAESIRYADTVVLYTPASSAAAFASWLCGSAMLLGFLFKQGLPARGALVRGPLFIDRENATLLGKGLLAAHELEINQAWAGATLDETSLFEAPVDSETIGRAFASGLITRYEVPMKHGPSIERPCLDWPYVASGTTSNVQSGLFGDGPHPEDVELKVVNTVTFYEHRKQSCPRPNDGPEYDVNPAYYPPVE